METKIESNIAIVVENLGRGLASLLGIFNPEVIILGGSVAEGYKKELLG
ncbi:MAG: hypothetical protein Ct9H90mP2_11850 [Dehalococcoidia bacterium]|nr:MAG: hypothetical protein Ct9H90mP2_11850 [Dehalococcoidia bacterium]